MTKLETVAKANSSQRSQQGKVMLFEITANLMNDRGQYLTQTLTEKLEKLLAQKGHNMMVESHSSNKIDQFGKDADLILLMPNFSFALNEIQKRFPKTPVFVVSQKEYGQTDSKKVYEKICPKLPKKFQIMTTIPKAHKVSTTATFLKIEFDNGEIKYLRSHLSETMTRSLSGKNWQKLLIAPTVAWLGTDVQIKPCGQVILNEKDTYSPEELWYNSVYHIQDL